jgi:hypothetical protein
MLAAAASPWVPVVCREPVGLDPAADGMFLFEAFVEEDPAVLARGFDVLSRSRPGTRDLLVLHAFLEDTRPVLDQDPLWSVCDWAAYALDRVYAQPFGPPIPEGNPFLVDERTAAWRERFYACAEWWFLPASASQATSDSDAFSEGCRGIASTLGPPWIGTMEHVRSSIEEAHGNPGLLALYHLFLLDSRIIPGFPSPGRVQDVTLEALSVAYDHPYGPLPKRGTPAWNAHLSKWQMRFTARCRRAFLPVPRSLPLKTTTRADGTRAYWVQDLPYTDLQTALVLHSGNVFDMSLRSANLQGLPEELGSLRHLLRLAVLDAGLRRVPEALGSLEELRVLDLRHNQLKGLPAALRNLRELRVLRLSGNRLSRLPAWIGDLQALEELRLDGNPLQALPSEIVTLGDLRVLDLSDTHVPAPEVEGWRQRLPHADILTDG